MEGFDWLVQLIAGRVSDLSGQGLHHAEFRFGKDANINLARGHTDELISAANCRLEDQNLKIVDYKVKLVFGVCSVEVSFEEEQYHEDLDSIVI